MAANSSIKAVMLHLCVTEATKVHAQIQLDIVRWNVYAPKYVLYSLLTLLPRSLCKISILYSRWHSKETQCTCMIGIETIGGTCSVTADLKEHHILVGNLSEVFKLTNLA